MTLIVAHGYGLAEPKTIALKLPHSDWQTIGHFTADGNRLELAEKSTARLTLSAGFQGAVWLLRR